MELRKTAETATTITFGWDPVAGASGYRFTAEKQAKPSHTWDPTRSSVRFAKGSAWYRVEALKVGDTGEWPTVAPPPPPPPPANGAKLPALFSTDRQVIRPTVTPGQTVTLSGLTNVIVDLQWQPIRDSHDGIKMSNCRDVWVRHLDIAGVRNQAILVQGCQRVAVTDARIGPNNPDRTLPDWQKLAHAVYFGTSPDCLLGNVKVTGQRTGLGFQAYPDTDRMWVVYCDFNVPADLGIPSAGSGLPFVWGAGSSDGTLVGTINRGSRFQLVAGGAGAPQPAVRVIDCAELNRQDWYPDGQPNAVTGSWGNDPSIAGDPGYRLPWDPRTTGLGTF